MTTGPRSITLDSPRSTRTLNFRNNNSYTLIATNNASLAFRVVSRGSCVAWRR